MHFQKVYWRESRQFASRRPTVYPTRRLVSRRRGSVFHPSEVLDWLRMQLNRPSGSPLNEEVFWDLFDFEGAPFPPAARPATAGVELDLLVVLTTYERPQECAVVLKALHAALARSTELREIRVLVFHDRGESDYSATRALARSLFGDSLTWLAAKTRIGKQGFWRIYQTSFLAAQRLRPCFALYLQDDLEFEDSLLLEAMKRYRATAGDPLRRVIYLYADPTDPESGRWIRFERRDAGDHLSLTQWFDLAAFFVDRAFFELLAYRVIPVHPNRWRRKPKLSSGVGRQFTIRLWRRGNVYQAYPPLVYHGLAESQMNPQVRAIEPLNNWSTHPRFRTGALPPRKQRPRRG
jgi:hypothetical protein